MSSPAILVSVIPNFCIFAKLKSCSCSLRVLPLSYFKAVVLDQAQVCFLGAIWQKLVRIFSCHNSKEVKGVLLVSPGQRILEHRSSHHNKSYLTQYNIGIKIKRTCVLSPFLSFQLKMLSMKIVTQFKSLCCKFSLIK